MKRLEKIASLTRGYKSICDVGSDHGYVCIDAVKNYGVLKAYALDINEGPILNAKSNIESNKLSDKIETILSDGLKNFSLECEVCVISGMGGVLISKILEDSILKAKQFKCLILGANNEVYTLRKFLMENDFSIYDEDIVFENGHYYEIMVVKPNVHTNLNELDLKFGPILRVKKDDKFIKMYEKKLFILKENLLKVRDVSKRAELQFKINEIEEVLYE